MTSTRILIAALLLTGSALADAPRIRLNPPAGGGGGGGETNQSCELTGGADCVMTGPVRASDGSASLPSLALASDTNTGIYSVGADQLGLSTGGTLRLTLSTTAFTSTIPVVAPLGAVSTPSFVAVGGLSTGLWFPATSTAAISAAGTESMRFSATFASTTLPFYSRKPAVESSSSVGISAATGANILYANTASTSIIRFTLPTGTVVGSEFCFTVTDADGIQVRPGTSQTIRWLANTVSTSQDLTSTTIGDTVCVVAVKSADASGVSAWVVVSIFGSWSIV